MHFRSISDLNRDILAGLDKLPRDIDVVVGVARSGMIPATLISLVLNVPLAELQSFADRRLLAVGNTRHGPKTAIDFDEIRHALVVDDSVNQGSAMREARRLLEPLKHKFRITFAAIYGVPHAPAVDLVFETVPQPRVFEWNVMHHSILERACVDIDGVLCHDPTEAENDDGEGYLNFLKCARPRFIPTMKIGELVTSRLEKYRPETEAWLASQGVQYNQLVMLDLPSAEQRRMLGAHADFKAKHYGSSNAELFIESEFRQAQDIARISGKPVLSMEGPVICEPDIRSPLALAQHIRFRARRSGRMAILRLARLILGPHGYAAAKRAIKGSKMQG
jgi:uncharacterized HAD superfamily protein